MLKVEEFSQRINDLRQRTIMSLEESDLDIKIDEDDSERIKLVFVGQYSAGKSSILKMLTGRNDIEIGAGITTQQTHDYDWNGIDVIDTPGIHTEIRPDHDDVSYNAIASADMLVFVITNELFDSYMAEHFRKLAIDRDKAGEMILVVNKMERTAKGNCAEQQDIIKEDLRQVLEPYTPEQLYISFLDAESYLDSIEERENDPEVADELVERSGYSEFVQNLDDFVNKKSLYSKQTKQLYEIDDCLEKAIMQLQPKSEDSDINALEESLLQQRHMFVDARSGIGQAIMDIFIAAASKIRNQGNDAANLIVDGCKQENVEKKLQDYVISAQNIIDKCQREADNIRNSRLEEMGQKLEDLENSEFSRTLKANLSGKFDSLPDGIKNILTNTGTVFQKGGQAVLNNAYKVGAEGGLKLTNFSGSTIHNMVLNIGHGLNFKFKPWQAIKITRGIAVAGQVFSVLGVGLSVFMQIKSDQDSEQISKTMKSNRQNIRSQFNGAADQLEDFARQYLADTVDKPLSKSISTIDGNIQDIRDTIANKSSECHNMEKLQKECRNLIREIHSESTVDEENAAV